jgi:hypothetical protein
VNRTWHKRIRSSGLVAGAAAAAVVLSGSLITDATVINHWINPPTPTADIAREQAWSVVADGAAVMGFAEHCVTLILSANATTPLAGCNPREHPYTFDPTSTVAPVAAGAHALTPKYEGMIAGTKFYAVKVMVQVRPYPSAAPDLEYFSLPIAVADGVAAVDRITRINPPPAGPNVSLGYDSQVKADTPIYGVLSGFLGALLADTGDLSRYITTDSAIAPIGGYARDSIHLAVTLSQEPPENPTDGQLLGAHLEVGAARAGKSFTSHTPSALTTGADQLSYAVQLRCVSGTWFVAGIDAMPAVVPPKPSTELEGKTP